MVCDCTTSQQEREMGLVPCGSDCLNRMLLIECGSRCPCGEFCTNRNFKLKNNAKIEPFKTEMKGWGIRSVFDLKTDTFLIEYVGEVIDLREFKRRAERYSAQNNEHFYFMSLQNDLFIDATRKGNMSRFFNHSCDPNCETQKWTVNGELRIGFFTRRPVSLGEELTFDYQFQTVGKKKQKCFCGSKNCRGFLGASSTGSSSLQIKSIWRQDKDSISDNETTTSSSESSSDESSENDQNTTNSTTDNSLSNKEEKQCEIVESIEQKSRSSEVKDKDYELNDQIKSISSLTSKENVLKLCQLMFRTENVEMQLDILSLLLSTKSETSLKLFMDYHGLKLLWSWMIDLDQVRVSGESWHVCQLHLECRRRILEILERLGIKNRSTIDEYKLLTLVKKWAEQPSKEEFASRFMAENSEGEAELENSDTCADTGVETWCRQLLLRKIISRIDDHSNHKQVLKLLEQLQSKAHSLHDEWSNLKQSFKIPKKQQIEERKEHERELKLIELKNSSSTSTTTNAYSSNCYSSPNLNDNENSKKSGLANSPFNRTSSSNSLSGNYYTPSRYGAKSAAASNVSNSQRSYYGSSSSTSTSTKYPEQQQQQPSLTKEQRRQLFEQKVREEEEAAARTAAAAAAAQAQASSSTLPSTLYDHTKANQELTWFYDNQTSQWIQCYMPVQQQQQQSHANYYSQQNYYQYYQQNHHYPHSYEPTVLSAPVSQSTSVEVTKLHLTESHLQDLRQVVEQFQPAAPPPLPPQPPPPPPPPPPPCEEEQPQHSRETEKSLAAIEAKLPAHWKCKLNKKGRLYYFNIRTNHSQWEMPDETATTTITTSIVDMEEKRKTSLTDVSHDSSGITSDPALTEKFKLTKDQFRDKLSKLVVKIMQPYMRNECKIGRIANVDDFKHLARKFTHLIMDKELSRTTNLEELKLDNRVRMKAEELVKRTMAKCGAEYAKSKDDSLGINLCSSSSSGNLMAQ